MEKGVGDVKVPGCPPSRGDDGEHRPDRHWLHHRCECFALVDTYTLSKTTHYPLGFCADRVPSGLSLCLNTHLSDNVGTQWLTNETPGFVALKSVEFAGRDGVPVGILQCDPRRGRDRGDNRVVGAQGVARIGRPAHE